MTLPDSEAKTSGDASRDHLRREERVGIGVALARRIKEALKARYRECLGRFLNKTFLLWPRLGFHILPSHFYSPIPDIRHFGEHFWSFRSELAGLVIDDEQHIQLLQKFASLYKAEYEQLPKARTPVPYEYFINNGAFESVDGEILYCMIRHFKPRRIIEIGSGNSTYLSAKSLLTNRQADASYECSLTAIEPHPSLVLQAGFPGLTRLIRKRVQDVPLTEFGALEANDILFIDSSHILSIGSDVQFEYLEILPRLKKGVVIHIHDIFLPAPYLKEMILKAYRFFNEQYLLQAFLAFNDTFAVLWGGSYMHLQHPDMLEQHFSSYDRRTRWPGSWWMQKVK